MGRPLARPVRFPENVAKLPKNRLLEPRGWPRFLAGLGGRRAGKPAACTDCLRGTTLYYGDVALCDHCARMRGLEALAKENSMNVVISGEEIELEPERFLGEHLDTIAKALVHKGVAKDYRTGRDLARERWPELTHAYDLGQVIGEGPRVTYRPSKGAELLRDLRARFNRVPGVPAAPNLGAVVAAISNGVRAEAERLGRDVKQAWAEALANDSGLREAADMPPAAASAVTDQ